MTILVDASVLVAMATGETDAGDLADRIDADADPVCCAIGIWEAVRAIARKRTLTAGEARRELDVMLDALAIRMVSIGEREAGLAIDAHDRYGKGTGHPAQLNMGDCFAYACAKANDARLLYKGNDFARTDLA